MSEKKICHQPILFAAAFPAPTFQLPAAAQAWLESEADFGTSSSAFYQSCVRAGASLKTSLVFYPQTGGADFAAILRGLVNIGYGVAWRVLDSQYFGVPQRRRRLFIVGHLGDGRAAQVLFEREGSSGDTPPRRETREALTQVTGTLSASGAGTARTGNARSEAQMLVTAYDGRGITSPGNRSNPRPGIHHTLHAGARESIITQTYRARRSDSFVRSSVAHTLSARDAKGGYATHVTTPHSVRRLTPTECERLQAFPDSWTACCSDTQRYKQLGNAVTVNVAEWIGKRIMEADAKARSQ